MPRQRTPWRIALLLACLIPTIPLLLVEIPLLADYPNHLARFYALGPGANNPAIAAMLAPNWTILPNLGTDAIMPWLVKILPIYTAGRLMLAVLLILPVIGCAALSAATFGRPTWWSLGAALVTCNALFLFGFLNFDLSYGLALLAAAAWFRTRETRPATTIAIASIASAALFFCHLMGVAFFLLLVGCYEIEQCWANRNTIARTTIRRAALLLPLLAAPITLYAISALQKVDEPAEWPTWKVKGFQALYPVINYDIHLDIATGLALTATLLAGLLTGRLEAPLRWRLALLALLALFLAMPFGYKGLYLIDGRFAVLMGFAVFAGLRPVRLPRHAAPALAIAGALLLTLRTAVVANVWTADAAIMDATRWVIEPIPPGSRVLYVPGDDAPPPPNPVARRLADGTTMDGHRAALLLIERQSFYPHLFANPAQQPIKWRPPYAELARITPHPPHARLLADLPLTGADAEEFPLWQSWPQHYDYVLLLEAGGQTPQHPIGNQNLTPLRSRNGATLYKVETPTQTSDGRRRTTGD